MIVDPGAIQVGVWFQDDKFSGRALPSGRRANIREEFGILRQASGLAQVLAACLFRPELKACGSKHLTRYGDRQGAFRKEDPVTRFQHHVEFRVDGQHGGIGLDRDPADRLRLP